MGASTSPEPSREPRAQPSPRPRVRSSPEPVVLTVQPADAVAVRRAQRLSRVRGLLLGLALGDAPAAAEPPGSGPLPGTSTTQLACFTAEGLLRAMVRADHRGTGPDPAVVFAAYRRWARLQGVPQPRPAEPTGWLSRVPALAERRGDAPAVVAAVQAARDPVPAPAPPTRRGHHALTVRLPFAAVAAPDEWTREAVAATHGGPDALDAAVAGVALARAVLATGSVPDALAAVGDPLLDDVRAGRPPAVLAPDHTAVSALRGGVALAARCPGPDAVRATLRSARELPVPDAVGPVAGALLGAAFGAEALPVELVARLELGWVVDTLARDLVAQVQDRPGGGEYEQPADVHWWPRYPGG